MEERDLQNVRSLTRRFDRRRLMVLLGSSAAATGAISFVQSIAGPAASGAPGPARGTFDSVAKAFYSKYAAQKWAGMKAKLDPAIVLTVPSGFPSPGAYTGPDAVV